MSSPFYPYPSPSSLPSPLSSLLPSIAQQTSGLALTPGTNPFLYPLQPNQLPSGSALPGLSSLGSQGGTSVRSGNVRREEVTLEDTLRGLEEGMSLVERAKSVLDEIGRIQAGVFGGETSAGNLDLLQIEYNQIINTLYLLAQSTSFGALPLLPSNTASHSDTDSSNPIPTIDARSSGPGSTAPPMDTPELIAWCESRAGLEFSRREGVKNGSKAVLDILKAR